MAKPIPCPRRVLANRTSPRRGRTRISISVGASCVLLSRHAPTGRKARLVGPSPLPCLPLHWLPHLPPHWLVRGTAAKRSERTRIAAAAAAPVVMSATHALWSAAALWDRLAMWRATLHPSISEAAAARRPALCTVSSWRCRRPTIGGRNRWP